ncbi:MAG: zinc-ribbon and DUF3426 domain-containing protein [Gammaproteobacteria bacterium]
MFVVCTSCQDVFKITSSHLAVAQGLVCCGGCRNVFDATASLYDTQDEAGIAVLRIRAAEQEINDVAEVVVANSDKKALVEKTDVNAEIDSKEAETEVEEVDVEATDEAPSTDNKLEEQPDADEVTQLPGVERAAEAAILSEEPEQKRVNISSKVWWGAAASVFLSFLIAGQYVWKERSQLAADSNLRPWMERYCAVINCELPLRKDLSKIAILEREIKDHPRVKNALLVSATILNDASFVQTYPVFEVSFSDVSGTPVSVRRFEPDEYLPDDQNADQGFQPGEKTHLVLEVVDPGKQAVSFQLEFL